jgi:hypothetical protein
VTDFSQGPQYHPTDVGHIKLASHLMQYIKLKFGWIFEATGPEVQADTLYWNDGEFCDNQRTSSSNANRDGRSGLLSLMSCVFPSEI